MAKSNGPSVFEISNRVISNGAIKFVVDDLTSHQSEKNTSAHEISNISGLQAILNGKQDIISGYTGTIDIVVGVDFMAQTVTSKTVNVSNGIITSIA